MLLLISYELAVVLLAGDNGIFSGGHAAQGAAAAKERTAYERCKYTDAYQQQSSDMSGELSTQPKDKNRRTFVIGPFRGVCLCEDLFSSCS